MNIKDIVKDNNTVQFSRYRKGFLYYTVAIGWSGGMLYEFPVPIEDCGDGEFKSDDKAILFMRYIRKALEDGTFVKTGGWVIHN